MRSGWSATSGSWTACYALPVINAYNLVALGDYTGWNTDIEGKAAAGRAFEMANFSLCREDPGGLCVHAGNDVQLSNGEVWGDLGYFTAYTAGADVDFPTGGTIYPYSPYVFRGFFFVTGYTATMLDSATVTGTTTVHAWGGVELVGADPGTNVFEVDAADLSAANHIRIEVPPGASVVVNVLGNTLALGGLGIDLDGGTPEATLWNLPRVSKVSLSAIDFQGSMLAPYADVTFHNGQFNGSLFADNVEGTGQFNLALLDTDFCVEHTW